MRVLAAFAVLLLAACPSKQTPHEPPPPAPVDHDEAPAPYTEFDIQDSHLVLPGPIVFDDTELDAAQSDASLRYIRDYLASHDDVTLVRIEGHVDADSPGEEGVMFSGERALNVGKWLIDAGIACDRMIIAGFGDTKPVADNGTPEGKAQNRRIEVVIAELRGHAIGGMPVDGSAPAAVPACP